MTTISATVNRPVTVAVLGAHSTGKSTFLARLAHELRCRHLSVGIVASLGQQAQRIGLPLLRHHTWASTLWIMTRGISNEIEAWMHSDVVLIDRAVPDALGYYRAALEYRGETQDSTATAILESLARNHSGCYDLMFCTTIDPALLLGENKIRDTNIQFRALADKHIHEVMRDLRLSHEHLQADSQDIAFDRAIDFVTTRLN